MSVKDKILFQNSLKHSLLTPMGFELPPCEKRSEARDPMKIPNPTGEEGGFQKQSYSLTHFFIFPSGLIQRDSKNSAISQQVKDRLNFTNQEGVRSNMREKLAKVGNPARVIWQKGRT